MPDLIRHPEAESLDSYEGGDPGFILCHPSPRFSSSFVMLGTQKSFEFKGLIETPLFPLFVRKIGVENSLLDYGERRGRKRLDMKVRKEYIPLHYCSGTI